MIIKASLVITLSDIIVINPDISDVDNSNNNYNNKVKLYSTKLLFKQNSENLVVVVVDFLHFEEKDMWLEFLSPYVSQDNNNNNNNNNNIEESTTHRLVLSLLLLLLY